MRSSFVPLRALARGLSVLALFTVAACSEPTGPSGSVGGSEILGPAVTAGMFDIANEQSACGVTVGGKVYCWGLYGAPANNQPGASFPAAQADGNVFASVSDAGQTTCALTLDGTAYCWGMNNYGQLGTGSASASATRVPQLVTGGHKFSKLENLGDTPDAIESSRCVLFAKRNCHVVRGPDEIAKFLDLTRLRRVLMARDPKIVVVN